VNARVILEEARHDNNLEQQASNDQNSISVGSDGNRAKRVKLLQPKSCVLRVLFSPVHVPVEVKYVVLPRGITAAALVHDATSTGTPNLQLEPQTPRPTVSQSPSGGYCDEAHSAARVANLQPQFAKVGEIQGGPSQLSEPD
jgi:hypothetical protein